MLQSSLLTSNFMRGKQDAYKYLSFDKKTRTKLYLVAQKLFIVK